MSDNRYDPDKHDDFIVCRREKRCGRKNAPQDSEDFGPECYHCGTHLGVQPVTTGEERTILIYDIHESGAGVGKTSDGFVVLTQDTLPDAKVTVEIKRVNQNHAEAKVVEMHEIDEEDREELERLKGGGDEDDKEKRSGRRDDFFGS